MESEEKTAVLAKPTGASGQMVKAYLRRFLGALAATVVLLVTYWFFVHTKLGQMIDTLSMFSLHVANKRLPAWEQVLLREWFWYLLIPMLILAALVTVCRRRWALGVRMTVMVGFTCLLTQILKYHVFIRPQLGITYHISNSLPSGHTTCAVAGAVALVMVSSYSWRFLVSQLATLYSALVGLAVIAARWHRPSDVWTAVLVVVAFTLLTSPIEYARTGKGARGKVAVNLLPPKKWPTNLPTWGGIIAMMIGFAGLVKFGVDLRALKPRIPAGQVTEYLQHMALTRHSIAIGIDYSVIIFTIGLIWFALGEVTHLVKIRNLSE